MDFIKAERQNMKLHPEMNEVWLQDIIASDPSILGLGELEVRDRERIHKGAGRLDFLLQHPETRRRYELEVQFGATDPSHIIRTLEYWDIERKRYPQYDHCAVIVAELITARFLNVISLFNGFIPLIAIQMQAVKVGEAYSIVFTTVLDQLTLGFVEEDERTILAPANRDYWERKASRQTVEVADQVYRIASSHVDELQLNFNQHYIGFIVGNKPLNFCVVKPRKKYALVELKVPQSDDIDAKLQAAGYDVDWRDNHYLLQTTVEEVRQHPGLLSDLLKLAYEQRIA